MVPARIRRLVEDLVPWYDRAEEARHDERTRYIRDRSIQIRQHVEHQIAIRGSDRIRRAYQAYADGVER